MKKSHQKNGPLREIWPKAQFNPNSLKENELYEELAHD